MQHQPRLLPLIVTLSAVLSESGTMMLWQHHIDFMDEFKSVQNLRKPNNIQI
jgi:hypothetical protein